MITAMLPGQQSEPAARKCLRRTSAAQMNYCGQLLPSLTADFRLAAMAKNRGDVPVQEHRRKLCGVARHDPRMERGRGTPSLSDGMVENTITFDLGSQTAREVL
jgi:hypothetical protein